MNKFKYKYSLVIPVYNSASNLLLLYTEIKKSLDKEAYQVVFVDDDSTDNSWKVLKDLKTQSPENITLVALSQNFGQHVALYCGLMHSNAEYLITLDDDLQHHPKEIIKLVDAAKSENADVVYGIYEKKKHGAIRNGGSYLFAKIVNKFASSPLKGSSFKLIRADVVEKLLSHNHYNFYLDEVLAWYSRKTAFVQVEHLERNNGVSGYTPASLIKMSVRILLNYTALPLKFITYLGILSSMVSFGFGIYYLYVKFTSTAQTGFSAIIVSIFFSTGLILFSLGIIGEYISRLFLLQTGKPPFKIREVL